MHTPARIYDVISELPIEAPKSTMFLCDKANFEGMVAPPPQILVLSAMTTKMQH